MIIQRPGETEIQPIGDPLKTFWKGFTTSPGSVVDGQYSGSLIRDGAGIADGYAEVECKAIRFDSATKFSFYTALRQIASPMRIYSTYRDLNPFVMFTCRVLADFNTSESYGIIRLMNESNEAFKFELHMRTTGIWLNYLGTEIQLSNAAKNDIIETIGSQRLLTKAFDFYVCAKRITPQINGLRAEYETRFFVVGTQAFEVHRATSNIRFNDRYQAEFSCNTRL